MRTGAGLAAFVGASTGLRGQVTYYGPDNNVSGNGNGFGTATSFTWNLSAAVWNTDPAGNKNAGVQSVAWVNGTGAAGSPFNNAVLTSGSTITTALTLTLGTAITAGSITANPSVLGTGGSWTIANAGYGLTLNTGSTTNASLTLGGGTLSLAAVGTYSFRTITFAANTSTTLDFGSGIGTRLESSAVVIEGNATVKLNNFVAGTDAWVAGSISPAPNTTTGAVTGVTWSSGAGPTYGQGYWSNGAFSTTPIPEPSSYGAVLMTACAGVIGWRRRRRRKAAAARA